MDVDDLEKVSEPQQSLHHSQRLSHEEGDGLSYATGLLQSEIGYEDFEEVALHPARQQDPDLLRSELSLKGYLVLVREVVQKAPEVGRSLDHHAPVDLDLKALGEARPDDKYHMACHALLDFSEHPLFI